MRAERAKRVKTLGIAANDPPPPEPGLGRERPELRKVLGPGEELRRRRPCRTCPARTFRKVLGPGEEFRPVARTELSDEQRTFQASKMAVHAAMVDRMDREVGRILDQLKEMGATEKTLILFASDNGASGELLVRADGHDPAAPPGSAASFLCVGPGWAGACNTPLRRHKTWVHEGGIATPLIAHWPDGIAARGELRHNPGHLVDVVPTVLELAGGKTPAEYKGVKVPPPPGKSLVPAFARDNSVPHDELWWYHEGEAAVRVGDWKLVNAGQGRPWELYDLARDRGETTDLAAKHADKARDLAARWQARFDECKRRAAGP